MNSCVKAVFHVDWTNHAFANHDLSDGWWASGVHVQMPREFLAIMNNVDLGPVVTRTYFVNSYDVASQSLYGDAVP